jgi:hypothetical protein
MKQAFISILTIAILCSFSAPNKANIQIGAKTAKDNVTFNLNAASDTYGSVEFINQDTYADNTYYWNIGSYGLQISIPTGNYEVLVTVNDNENDGFHSVTYADSTQTSDMPGLFFCDWDLVSITDTDNIDMSVQ